MFNCSSTGDSGAVSLVLVGVFREGRQFRLQKDSELVLYEESLGNVFDQLRVAGIV